MCVGVLHLVLGLEKATARVGGAGGGNTWRAGATAAVVLR